MRSIFIITFLLCLFFEEISSRRCIHCRITQYGECQHPDLYYPPIAYCGALNATCGTVNLSLVYTSGFPLMSFGDKYSRWAIFKGCVKGDYCKNKKNYTNLGGIIGTCDTCDTDLCNSADSNLINFVKVFVFVVVIVVI